MKGLGLIFCILLSLPCTIIAPDPIPREVQTIRVAYHAVGQRVTRALQVQIGDSARLLEQRNAALALMETIQPVHSLFHLFIYGLMSLIACQPFLR